MNTSFHYNGLSFFERTKAYDEQRKAYKNELITKFSENNKVSSSRKIYSFKRALIVGYKMSIYRMKLLF